MTEIPSKAQRIGVASVFTRPRFIGSSRRRHVNRGLAPRLIAAGLFGALLGSCGGGGGSTTPPLTVTAETLYSFGGTSTDGMGPTGVLFQGNDGNFYGTTISGGTGGGGTGDTGYTGNGTVFKITPMGEETVLHSFAGAPADGNSPVVLIQGSDGNLYGTTQLGGANNLGTVFKLTPEGVETILYSFTGGSDGECPAGGLIQGSDGDFYGTTGCFGTGGYGTVFKLTPQGVETTLYTFTGTTTSGPDGAIPFGQLVRGSDGNFYGVTAQGGLPCVPATVSSNATTCGTVFKVTPEGIETILHRFSGPDGQNPIGLIQGSDGNFYGTTFGGNTNTTGGTVFSITPEGVDTTFYTFATAQRDGDSPEAGLIQGSDGNFYGTAAGGGESNGGTMFQLTPAGVVTVLYSFPNSSSPETNLVQGSDANLYGTAYRNGAYNRGYFYKLVLSSH